MADYLFPDFLSDPRQYQQAEALWRERFGDLIRRIDQEALWESPWLNTHFANGTPCRADATCLNGSCGGCGGSTQACCDGRTCTASRAACAGADVGMCQACGGGGQSCCADHFCASGLGCDFSKMAPLGACVPCGGAGAPACP